jgi:hypothetical protein
MMHDLLLPVLPPTIGLAVLAAVYLWSPDPGVRTRAIRLIRILFRR